MSDAVSERMIPLVVDAHRALATAGHGDMVWGHIGVRDPEGRGVWTKASGIGMEEVDASSVVLVSFDGDVLVGDRARHIEVFIHLEILRTRSDVDAVVHSHAIEATAFASLDVALRAISHAATPFLGEDVPRFTETSDLIDSSSRGRALAGVIGAENGCLIPGHGLVTVGADTESAVLHAVLLRDACRAQLLAEAAGGPRRWTSPEEVAKKRRDLWPPSAARAAFGYLTRRAAIGNSRTLTQSIGKASEL